MSECLVIGSKQPRWAGLARFTAFSSTAYFTIIKTTAWCISSFSLRRGFSLLTRLYYFARPKTAMLRRLTQAGQMTLLHWRILVIKWRHRDIWYDRFWRWYRNLENEWRAAVVVRKFYISFPMKLSLGPLHCIIIYNCDTFISVLGGFRAEMTAKNAYFCEDYTSRTSRAKCAFLESKHEVLFRSPVYQSSGE